MIKKAAAGYVGWLCANGIVAPEKNKIYAYGMELVLSGLVNVLSVLLISILIYLAIAVISLVTLLILSPSEAKNKPLTPEQRRRNRRRSLILGGLNLAIGIFLIWGLQAPAPWCTSYYLGVIAASISMWAAQIKERMCVQ